MGESSSADQVYDNEFCQLQFLQWDWLLPFSCECTDANNHRRRGDLRNRTTPRTDRGVNRLGLYFDSCTYCLFAIEQRTERFLNAGIDYYYSVWVTNYARLWVIDDLLINYYRHISTITIFCFYFSVVFKFIVCLTFAVTNDDSCKKRNDLFCFVWENNFASILVVCVCLFVCVNSISNGHTVGKEGSW